MKRKFLVHTVENKEVVILGVVESDYFPATIENDHEYSKAKFGFEYCKVIELSEKQHTKTGWTIK